MVLPGFIGPWLEPKAGAKVEAEMAVQMHDLDDNGRRRWWPTTVSKGVSGKSEQSGSEVEREMR
jgi:hypothetical protein